MHRASNGARCTFTLDVTPILESLPVKEFTMQSKAVRSFTTVMLAGVRGQTCESALFR